MKVHFICRGNVFRSMVAETYLRSLHIPNVETSSSGTIVSLHNPQERQFFENTMNLLKHHGIDQYAKDTSHQLIQNRVDGQDIVVCMNQRVIDEASLIVTLPPDTLNWNIVDIGEGNRTEEDKREQYEEEIYQEITALVDKLVLEVLLAAT